MHLKADPGRVGEYGVPVVIAVTVEDPTHAVQVNNEMAVKWRARGYVTEEVQVQPRVRARFGTSIW
jgi:hypothetical protein